MSIININSKSKLKACCFNRRKKCPNPTSNNEPPIAEELRQILSGNIFIADTGVIYTFINQLTTYPPSPCQSCEAYSSGFYHIATVNDLRQNTEWLKVDTHYLYPMNVWALSNGKPAMVKVSPGSKKPIKIIKKVPTACPAYIICVCKEYK